MKELQKDGSHQNPKDIKPHIVRFPRLIRRFPRLSIRRFPRRTSAPDCPDDGESNAAYDTQRIRKSGVDSPPPRSTCKWSPTAHPVTRNIPGCAVSKLLYKSSGPYTATAQNSRRTPCVS